MDLLVICNLYVIKSFSERNSNIIDSLIPFVEFAMSKMEKRFFKRDELILDVKKTCGIDIPCVIINSILNRLKADKKIITYEANDTIQLAENFAGSTAYLEELANSKRKISNFIDSFLSVTKSNQTHQTVIDSLDFLLKSYLERVSEKSNEKKRDLVHGIMHDDFIRYIEYISLADDEKYHVFERIFYGYLIQNLVINNNADKESKTITDTVVYLDSNFILRLLDYQPEPFCIATNEVFSMLKDAGFTIKAFDITIEEVQGAITYGLNSYEKNKDKLEAIYRNNTKYIEGVEGAIFRRKLKSTSSIVDEVTNIRSILREKGIITDNTDLSQITIDDKLLNALAKKKERKVKSRKNSTDNEYFKKKVFEHARVDLQVVTRIRNIRSGRKHDFTNCKYILLTCDNTLFEFNKKQHDDLKTIPECITESMFANMLFVLNPQKFGAASLPIFISVLSASNYANIESLQNFHKALLSYLDKNPDAQEVLNNLFNNQSLFSEISDFDVVTENDADARIALLIKKARKNNGLDSDDLWEGSKSIAELVAESESLSRENSRLRKLIEEVKDSFDLTISLDKEAGKSIGATKYDDIRKAVFALTFILLTFILLVFLALMGIKIYQELNSIDCNIYNVAILTGLSAYAVTIPFIALRKDRLKEIVDDLISEVINRRIIWKIVKILTYSLFSAFVGFVLPIIISVLGNFFYSNMN